MYLCGVLDISILHISMIFIFAFGIVPTVWDFLFLFLILFTQDTFVDTRVRTGILFIFCGFFFLSDGKSKSNKESILHNWKTLKQSIEPVDFVPELERCNFLPKSSFENLGSKSRSHQATLVLIKVYRQVQSSEKEYQKFVEILRRYNGIAADALSNAVGGPINKSETGK